MENTNNAMIGRALVAICGLNGDVIGCEDYVSIDIRL